MIDGDKKICTLSTLYPTDLLTTGHKTYWLKYLIIQWWKLGDHHLIYTEISMSGPYIFKGVLVSLSGYITLFSECLHTITWLYVCIGKRYLFAVWHRLLLGTQSVYKKSRLITGYRALVSGQTIPYWAPLGLYAGTDCRSILPIE